jgi:hypothetical protein
MGFYTVIFSLYPPTSSKTHKSESSETALWETQISPLRPQSLSVSETICAFNSIISAVTCGGWMRWYCRHIKFCVSYSIKIKSLYLGGRQNYRWLKDELRWFMSKRELFCDVGRNITLQCRHFKSSLIASCQRNSPVLTWLKRVTPLCRRRNDTRLCWTKVVKVVLLLFVLKAQICLWTRF